MSQKEQQIRMNSFYKHEKEKKTTKNLCYICSKLSNLSFQNWYDKKRVRAFHLYIEHK